MYSADPRYIISDTYTLLRDDLALWREFDTKLQKVIVQNNHNSPDEAIALCLEYQGLITNVISDDVALDAVSQISES